MADRSLPPIQKQTRSAPASHNPRQPFSKPEADSSTDLSSDEESVPRSCPGDWSTDQSSGSDSSPENPEDYIYSTYPFNSKQSDSAGGENVNGTTLEGLKQSEEDDYEDDFEGSDSDIKSLKMESRSSSRRSSASSVSSYRKTPDKPKRSSNNQNVVAQTQPRLDYVQSNQDLDKSDEEENVYNYPASDIDPSVQRYRLRIYKKLLSQFDLEKTKSHYRSLNAVSYKLNPRDFSSDCTTEAQMVKERLLNLTGSDDVRINDQDYMDRLRVKVWQDHETKMDRLEREREEEERQRMRRLMNRGIIGPEQLRDDRQLSKEYRQHGDKRWRSNKHQRRKSERIKSPTRAKSAPAYTAQHKQKTSRISERSGRETPRTMISCQFESESSAASTLDPDRSSLYSIGSRRPSSTFSTRSRRYEHPTVQKMREEEDVEELYRLAEEVVITGLNKDVRKKAATEEGDEDEYKYNPNKPVKIKF